MKMKKGDVITSMQEGKQLIIRFNKTLPVDNVNVMAAKAKVISELSRDEPAEMTSQYIQYLRHVFQVKINHDLLDSLQPQGS